MPVVLNGEVPTGVERPSRLNRQRRNTAATTYTTDTNSSGTAAFFGEIDRSRNINSTITATTTKALHLDGRRIDPVVETVPVNSEVTLDDWLPAPHTTDANRDGAAAVLSSTNGAIDIEASMPPPPPRL